MSYLSVAGGIRLPELSAGDRATQVGSSRHFTGGLVIGTGAGRRLGVESHLEAQAAMIMSTRQETSELVEQVRFEWSDEFGEVFNHYMDLVQSRVDGKTIGFAVRPTARVSNTYLMKLARIKEQAIASGFLDDFRLFTEKDVCPVEWFNARLFHSVRRPDPFGDPVAADVVRQFSGVITIDELVDATRLAGMGFRAVVRLIRTGQLEMVRHERIDHQSQVFKAKAF
ncbi:hypothetical protein EOK75_02030 [Pseudorhodobacter turbinis]|uniref:Uncharacterized protein n=1 Tax=Pseudorhodobacter turbinis TaxID=2500533 RepID=A0A4P8EDC5_9RHOB|nr:hypothetical protein [Pseudorhodobacter turbinis]QCO54683.1 hypothetical protein EOK75_02030 [Pseudorhodobacter turbinis]